jgi:hypothetical protein
MSDTDEKKGLATTTAPAVDAEVISWQESYNARVQEQARREAEKALKGRERIFKALDVEDTALDTLRGAAAHQANAAGFAALMEEKLAKDVYLQFDTLSVADKKAALRLFSRTGQRAVELTQGALKLERLRAKVPLRPPATAETIMADPAKGLELLEEAANYVDRLRGLTPTKIVTDELMEEIEREDAED